MIKTLGGSMFTHNVDSLDYCFREALSSLEELCDHVVVLDCKSTDGTLEALREIARNSSKIELVEGGDWRCAPGYERLAILANEARKRLATTWHFMLQADEVIHENSFPYIRLAMEYPGECDAFHCRRFNLYGDCNHYISLTSAHRPCNDQPIRLAVTAAEALGDAESLGGQRHCFGYIDKIEIFHYGMVRNWKAFLDKSISFQSWFWNGHNGLGPDHRLVEMRETGEKDPFRIIPRSEIVPLTSSHPKYMKDWVAKRLAESGEWMK